MKLKLFSFMKQASDTDSEKKNTEDVNSESTENNTESSSEEEVSSAESQDSEESESEESEDTTSETNSAVANEAVISHVNAMGSQIERLTAQVSQLMSDRKSEIDAAASEQSLNITASQGVPTNGVGGVSGESAGDAPANREEFYSTYSKIEDPSAAGKYYAKHSARFNN